MSRSFPIVVATIFVAGAVGAEAHSLTRSAGPSTFPQHVSAFAGTSAAQSDGEAAMKVEGVNKLVNKIKLAKK